MKQFTTIEKLDTSILYALELASSVSVLLLAFGFIASMANDLTKGSVLTDIVLLCAEFGHRMPQRAQAHGTTQRCSKGLSNCRDVRFRFYRLCLGIILCFSFIRILFRAATREEEHGC
jgi:hypothetical protein